MKRVLVVFAITVLALTASVAADDKAVEQTIAKLERACGLMVDGMHFSPALTKGGCEGQEVKQSEANSEKASGA